MFVGRIVLSLSSLMESLVIERDETMRFCVYLPAVKPLSLKSRMLSDRMSETDSQSRLCVIKRVRKYNGKKSIVKFVTNHVVKNGA